MKTSEANILCLISLSISLNGCAVGWTHTSDATLIRVFNAHQSEFETLLAEVQADSRLTTLQRNVLIYAGRHVDLRENKLSDVFSTGMTEERWTHYQKELRALGLDGVMKGQHSVEFRVDAGSISNGDSYKGYEYTTAPVSSVRTNLDGYRISDKDRDRLGGWLVHAPIRGNWYLYLFVNG